MNYILPKNFEEKLSERISDKSMILWIVNLANEASNGINTSIQETAHKEITEKKTALKLEIKDELRNELTTKSDLALTKEVLEAQIRETKTEIKETREVLETRMEGLNMKFNILIVLVCLFGTFLNPNVLNFLKALLKI